jgi:hypothetical protein
MPLAQASFCHVPSSQVLTMHDVSNIWRVPLMMQAQGAHETILRVLGMSNAARCDTSLWRQKIADKWDSLKEPVTIAMVGWPGSRALNHSQPSSAGLSALSSGPHFMQGQLSSRAFHPFVTCSACRCLPWPPCRLASTPTSATRTSA